MSAQIGPTSVWLCHGGHRVKAAYKAVNAIVQTTAFHA
jgi:hypothetical protein